MLFETSISALETAQAPAHYVPAFYPGSKRSKLEVYHSFVSSGEVKNVCSYNCTLCVCLHGLHKENFNISSFLRKCLKLELCVNIKPKKNSIKPDR
jgi:hypothetical protein